MIPIAKPNLGPQEACAAYDAVLSGWVTQGPKVAEFEAAFAQYVGTRYATAVSSCTTALHCALLAAGIKPGDEVICPSMSFIATANAIRYCGAVPVFAEVNNDCNIDAIDAKRRITPRTRAILIVHQMGQPADIDAFKILCRKRNLTLIEDAACAVGSVYKGKKIGCHSDLVCFSFHPRKVLTTGEGGMITTSDPRIDKRLKRLRQHGMSVNDRERHLAGKIITEEYLEIGFNYRMTDIQAAIGCEQLKRIDALVSERRAIAAHYADRLSAIPWIRLPVDRTESPGNFQSFPIYLSPESPINRDDLMEYLFSNGIASRRGIMTIHRERAYRDLGYRVKLPRSERLADNSLLIPMYNGLAKNEITRVVSTLKKAFPK